MRESREKGPFWRAFTAMSVLGIFFFTAYGLCNWYTSTRQDVGQWYWEWERHLPFIPEMIVPYMSIDLFFIGAFFLCRSRQELGILSRRIFWVITLSSICFLLFPLEFGLERPKPTGGWTLPWFNFLHAGDLPYNMAPSLHISLRAILWITYGRHLTGTLRTVTKFWFLLVGASTLLVWQHHLIDVITGFLMAWFIVAMIHDPKVQAGTQSWIGTITPKHRKLASRYGLSAVACSLLSLFGNGWTLLLWPAIALGIIALAYATANPRWIQKSSGTFTAAAEWILLPVLLGTRVYQHRWLTLPTQGRALSQQVWFGRRLSGKEVPQLLSQGFTAILDLTSESNSLAPLRERLIYKNLALLDLTTPTVAHLTEATDFLATHANEPGKIYLHCQLGLLRSASVAAAWLLRSGQANDVENAIAQIITLEPRAIFTSETREILEGYLTQLHAQNKEA